MGWMPLSTYDIAEEGECTRERLVFSRRAKLGEVEAFRLKLNNMAFDPRRYCGTLSLLTHTEFG
jgi:hypothetical protein